MATVILTFAEARDGKLRRPSLEAVSEARRLADVLGGPRIVSRSRRPGVSRPGRRAGQLRRRRRSTSSTTRRSRPTRPNRTPAPSRRSITEQKPTAVLMAVHGDWARISRRASRPGWAPGSSPIAWPSPSRTGGSWPAGPIYAGKAYATVTWEGEPQMATLRPNVFPLGSPDAARKARGRSRRRSTRPRGRGSRPCTPRPRARWS